MQLIHFTDLCAVVSPIPHDQFGQDELAERLRDNDWVCERVIAHQRVLATLANSYTLLPLQFCTLYRDAGRVRDALAQQYAPFDQALTQLSGAREWGVKIYGDRQRLAAWLADYADDLQPLREQIAGTTSGAGYLLRRKLTQAATQRAANQAQVWANDAHAAFVALARSAATLPLQTPQIHGHDGEMLLSAAYLVDDSALAHFQALVQAQHQSLAERGLACTLSGPWPPYSFVAAFMPPQAA